MDTAGKHFAYKTQLQLLQMYNFQMDEVFDPGDDGDKVLPKSSVKLNIKSRWLKLLMLRSVNGPIAYNNSSKEKNGIYLFGVVVEFNK